MTVAGCWRYGNRSSEDALLGAHLLGELVRGEWADAGGDPIGVRVGEFAEYGGAGLSLAGVLGLLVAQGQGCVRVFVESGFVKGMAGWRVGILQIGATDCVLP